MLINDRPITLLKFELCRVKTRESARFSAVPSLYHSLYRFSISISLQRYAIARERDLLSRYTRYIFPLVAECYSTASKVVVPLSVSFIASIRDASPRIVKTYRAFESFQELYDLSRYMHQLRIEHFLVIFCFDIERYVYIVI